MKVGNILALSAFMSGNKTLSDKIKAATENEYVFTDDEKREVDNLISCYNITISELNDERLPVIERENVRIKDGKVFYKDLKKTALEIKSVYRSDIELKFKCYPRYFTCDGDECTVEYNYIISPVTDVTEDCVYNGTIITPRIIAEGVTAERYLTASMFEESVLWRDRYDSSLKAALIKRKVGIIKQRGWY